MLFCLRPVFYQMKGRQKFYIAVTRNFSSACPWTQQLERNSKLYMHQKSTISVNFRLTFGETISRKIFAWIRLLNCSPFSLLQFVKPTLLQADRLFAMSFFWNHPSGTYDLVRRAWLHALYNGKRSQKVDRALTSTVPLSGNPPLACKRVCRNNSVKSLVWNHP